MVLFVPDEGLEFVDAKLGPMLLKEWGGCGEYWLFRKGPEGGWVSHRPASIDDVKALLDAIRGGCGEDSLKAHGA